MPLYTYLLSVYFSCCFLFFFFSLIFHFIVSIYKNNILPPCLYSYNQKKKAKKKRNTKKNPIQFKWSAVKNLWLISKINTHLEQPRPFCFFYYFRNTFAVLKLSLNVCTIALHFISPSHCKIALHFAISIFISVHFQHEGNEQFFFCFVFLF